MLKIVLAILGGWSLAFSFLASAAGAEPARPAAEVPAATAGLGEDGLSLYACVYGRSLFPESFAFRDGRKDQVVKFAWAFYVLRSGADVTLVDTGFSNPAIAGKWHVTLTAEPADLLAALKIDPAKISSVIVTHIHYDHIGNLALFSRAQVFISRRDRDDYVNKKSVDGVSYDESVAAILNDPARTHVIGQRETLAGGLEVEVVGGHTAGSAVVHLSHRGTRYVLAGDECYLCANRDEQRPIGRTADLKRNLAFLTRIADPAIVILPCHDPVILTRYPAVSPNIVRIFGH